MTLIEQIQEQMKRLPPEKQGDVVNSAQSISAEAERSKRIKAALEKLAELGTFADIADPVEWQRQTRKDRPLPGRAVR